MIGLLFRLFRILNRDKPVIFRVNSQQASFSSAAGQP
jgi:hypothetical protein